MFLFLFHLGCSSSEQHTTKSDELRDNTHFEQIELTWFGVTTIRIQFGETIWLLDPFFSRTQEGILESNETGLQYMQDHVGSKVDRIFIGHSHYDHILDAKSAGNLYTAPVYGTQTTCFLMGEQECHVVVQGWKDTIDGVEVTAIRTPHWRPDWEPIGSFSELEEHSEDMVSAPNGGVITYLFEFPNQQTIIFQDSMGSLDIPDDSSENYRQNLSVLQNKDIDLWLTCGDCLEESDELEAYLTLIQPTHATPIHWDGLMPNLEIQPTWTPTTSWIENMETFDVQEINFTGYHTTITVP